MPPAPIDEAGWLELVPQLRDELLCRRLGDLMDARAAHAAIDAALTPEAIGGVILPLVDEPLREVMERLHGREERAWQLVGSARASLEVFAAEPGVVNEALVRAALEDPAVEAVMRDVLDDALAKFSRAVNPFTLGGSLIDALPALARGAIKRTLEAMRREFEERLEPEIRKFLDRFAKDALHRSVERVLARQEEPEQVALRKRMVGVVLEQPLSELCWPPRDRRAIAGREALQLTLLNALMHEAVKSELHGWLDEVLDKHGDHTLGEALEAMHITLPEPEPFARAAWPIVRVLLERAQSR